MRLTKSFLPKDLKEGQHIIIYGAGRYGELALRGLQHLNLEPLYFADKTFAGKKYLGIKVISPNELKNHKKDVILIASYNYFSEMIETLKTTGNIFFYDILKLLELKYDESILSEYTLDEKNNYFKYFNVVENAGKKGLVITHCEVVLTERCTLHCKDCANLMQYYSHPEDIKIDDIIHYFKYFLNTIDMLLELRLLGGEPFLYKDLSKILNEFYIHSKIQNITVYTNSTIMPSEEILEHLKNPKISVHMSDYGLKNSKIKQLEILFKKNQINYYIHKYEKWYDMGGIQKRGYDNCVKRSLYENCIMSKCYTFYRGKFYLCPRAAHGEQLGAFVNPRNEFVDFTVSSIDINEKKEELKNLLKGKKFITACDFCNGASAKSKEVTAAIQIKR